MSIIPPHPGQNKSPRPVPWVFDGRVMVFVRMTELIRRPRMAMLRMPIITLRDRRVIRMGREGIGERDFDILEIEKSV